MDFSLSRYNQKKRNGKKVISQDYIIRKRGELLHVCLNSPGCRYRKSGSCVMCDYGQGYLLREENIRAMLVNMKEEAAGMKSILIGSLGSVLDPEEVLPECLELICRVLNEISVETVIFETHYTMVNREICQWLRQQLPLKDVVIEIGLESVDSYVQEKCLNKKVDLHILEEKIRFIHEYRMSVTANVFLGAPFLTAAKQIDDAEKTVYWAIHHKVDSVVIFPANIRKNTLLEELYQKQKYSRIWQWAVFELLDRIPVAYLDRIYLAWYGDWVDYNEVGEITNLPPYSCERCREVWMDFYAQFLQEHSSIKRKSFLKISRKKLVEGCNCRWLFEKSMDK